MNINNALRRRSLGLSGRLEIDFAIDRLKLKEAIKLTNPNPIDQEDHNVKNSGPIACARLGQDRLAVANEDGYINLLTTKELKDKASWIAHENAVFDIKASPDQRSLLTASGDATIRRWDVETKQETLKLTPHYSSIKSISMYDNNTLASGSRDGTVKVHDLRQKDQVMIVIRDAHRNQIFSKHRRISTKTDPISCVTNVVFDPNFPRLYSTGANDATIKLWDLRRAPKTNKPRRTRDGEIMLNQPLVEVHHPSRGVHCGYSDLLISSGKVYASCSDNKIYCYDNFSPNSKPLKFAGYRYDTCLRLAIMDDRFLFSGGKGGGALVWNLRNKQSSRYFPETTRYPIGQLKPDQNDSSDTTVIETDWDSLSVFTLRDDRLICKWTMHHVLDNERQQMLSSGALDVQEADVSIQLSDIMDVNVLRPNHRLSNNQSAFTDSQHSQVSSQ